MKLWKQLIAIVLALTLLAALVACDPAQEETQGTTPATTEATEAPTTEPTVEETVPPTTEDMSIYSAFFGTWYEGGSDVANRLIISDEETTWRYEDEAAELLMTGYYELQEEILALYNNDLELVTTVRLDGDTGIYLEPCIDIAFELIQNNDFSKNITNSDSMDSNVIDDIGGEDPGVNDEVVD